MGFIVSIGLFKQYDYVDSGNNMSRIIQGYLGKMSRCTSNVGRTVALVTVVSHCDNWSHLGKCSGCSAAIDMPPLSVALPWYFHCRERGPVAESSTPSGSRSR